MDTFLLGLIVVTYLLAIAFLGLKGYKETKSAKDYLVGGGNIHPYVMAISYGATFISTSAIIGFGGVSAAYGMGTIWLTFLNILFGILIAFIFFGRKTREIGHQIDAHSFPEFLGKRYQSKRIHLTAGLIIFIAMPLYAAVVLIGGARFIESIFEIDFTIALTFFSIIIAAYVIAGGLKGVMYTDALQGTIMFLGMFFLLYFTYQKLGGITLAHERLSAMKSLVPETLQLKGHEGWTAYPRYNSTWWWVLSTNIILGVGIGVLAQPQLIVRFMTVKSNQELNRAVLIGSLFIFVSTGFIFTCGALSNVFFYDTTGKIALEAVGGNMDLIIPEFINRALPNWFVYIFMIALLSAGMSTLSSQFHTMGTSLGRDVFEVLFPNSKHSTIRITRIAIVLSILISMIIGYRLPGSIVARGTAIFFGVCASTFLPSYISALYWKRANESAIFLSMITGLLSSLFCLVFLHQSESSALGLCSYLFGKETLAFRFPWMIIDPILIALPLSTFVLFIVSLKTPSSKQLTKKQNNYKIVANKEIVEKMMER